MPQYSTYGTKAAPVGADKLLASDSEDSNSSKNILASGLPISTATQAALDLKETVANVALKAPIDSPTFTGTASFAGSNRIDSDGIKFNGDTAPANALDDYEEGTWTPAFSNIGTGTYADQTGTYIKIGKMVFAYFRLELATLGSASGNLIISGLPFTCSSSLGPSSSIFMTGVATNRDNLSSYVNPSSNDASLHYRESVNVVNLSHADFGGAGTILTTLTYQAA